MSDPIPGEGSATLTRAVDDASPRRQVARRTRATVAVAFAATSACFLGFARLDDGPDAIAVIVPVVAPPIVVPPVVVHTAPRVLAVPVLIAPLVDPACPVPPVPDRAIGRPVATDDARAAAEDASGVHPQPVAEVKASAVAPVIAVRSADEVWASVDDGAHFGRVLASDDPVRTIAVDDDGRIYAATDAALGVRDRRGRERWTPHPRPAPGATPDATLGAGRLLTIGHAATWLGQGGGLERTADGPWRAVTSPEMPMYELVGGVAWDGVFYRGAHIRDMCGLDDYVTSSYAIGGELRSATFHVWGGGPQLDVVDDVGASWRYQVSCHRDDLGDDAAVPCAPKRDRLRRDRSLLVAALDPTIGARVLFVDSGALVELCGMRAHPIAHAFGDDAIVAVDAGGRPLVIHDGHLRRWSPRFGWRELFRGAIGATWSGDGE